MIGSAPLIGYSEEKPGKFGWHIPLLGKRCSLVGWRLYHSKKAARRAALEAWGRVFTRGGMV